MTIDFTLSHGLNKVPGGQVITIYTDKILGITESSTLGVIVLLAGGVSLPVKETKSAILAELKKERENGNTNGDNNGK